jgi:hypothetical protein
LALLPVFFLISFSIVGIDGLEPSTFTVSG